MLPEDFLAQVDRDVVDFAKKVASADESTGIPKPPIIEISTTAMPPEVFNFELDPQTEAQAIPGGGGGPTPPPPCNPVTLEVTSLEVQPCMPELCPFGVSVSEYIDISVNGTKSLDVFDVTARCGDGSTPAGCYTFVFNYDCHYNGYLLGTCTGSPTISSDEYISWVVAKLGTTWYILGVGGHTGIDLFFYADTTDISSPIPNQITSYGGGVSCDDTTLPSSEFMDNWVGDCTPGSGDRLWHVVGINGTVMIT